LEQGEQQASSAGFHAVLQRALEMLQRSWPSEVTSVLAATELHRRSRAAEGIVACYAAGGAELPLQRIPMDGPVRRGAAALADATLVALAAAPLWGFDVWYRVAPIVVSYSSRLEKVTIGCPDLETAEALCGPGGLQTLWPRLGPGWGGRETIGGSPRDAALTLADARLLAVRTAAVWPAPGGLQVGGRGARQ
jgi:hypothetical protein